MNPETVKVVTGADAAKPPTPTDSPASTIPPATPPATPAAEAKPKLTEAQRKEILDRAAELGRAKAEEVKAARNQLRQIIGQGYEFKAMTGAQIKIPPMDGLKEKRALQIVLDFIANHGDLLSGFGESGDLTGAGIVQLLLSNVGIVYDDVVKLVSVLLGMPEGEVMEKMLFNDLLEVISPFLGLQAATIQSAALIFSPIAKGLARRSSTPGAFGSGRKS